MKNFAILFLLLFTLKGLAAQNHFVFIQSEDRRPFTVNFKGKNYNSTSSGYVIIPKIASGQHDFTVKFPKEGNTESKFYFDINKKDIGFNLKPASSSGWALTDLQSFVTVKPGERPSLAKADAASSNTSAISRLRKGIYKLFERQDKQTVSLRYLDVSDKNTDTIDILIPVGSTQKARTGVGGSAGRSDQRSSLLTEAANNETGLSLLAVKQQGYNTECVNLASGEDFNRLRRRMSSETTVDKMISEAKKGAKNKCYTTIQVKNLSSLFTSDAGKLKFFQALYPLVYDYIQYPVLEKEFSESKYAEQFRGMLQK